MIKEFTADLQVVASIDVRHTPATLVRIDTSALGINWVKGETYRIEIVADAFTEVENNRYPSPAQPNAYTFTTNANGPTISSTYPYANHSNWQYNTVVELTFNRDIEFNTTGSIVLRVVGGSDIATYSSGSGNWSISENVLTLNVDYALDSSTNYEIEVVGDPIVDLDGFTTEETGVVLSFTTYAGPALVSTVPGQTLPVTVNVIGGAQKSTTQAKFGTASLAPSGGGLEAATGLPTNGDFTVEYWGYITNRSDTLGHWAIIDGAHKITVESTTSPTGPVKLVVTDASGTTVINTTSTGLGDFQFRHISLVRSGSNFTVYLDGTSIINETSTVELPSLQLLQVGKVGSKSFRGYIDEFRVSNVARYTENFTPPTGPFENDSSTLLLLHMDGTNGATDFNDDDTDSGLIENNEEIVLEFDRNIQIDQSGSGQLQLFKDNGADPDIEVKTYSLGTGNWTITDDAITLNLDNVLLVDSSYYLTYVNEPITDLERFEAQLPTGNITEFTTYPGPEITSRTPFNNKNINPGTSTIEIEFNRNIFWGPSGNSIELMEVVSGGSDVQAAQYTSTSSNWNINQNIISFDTTGILELGKAYYFNTNDTPIRDSQYFYSQLAANSPFAEYTAYEAPAPIANPVSLFTAQDDSVYAIIEYNEDIVARAGGTADLYEVQSGSTTLLLTVDLTDTNVVTFTGNTISINLTNDLAAQADYYFLMDYGQIENLAGVPNFPVTNSSTLDFETVHVDNPGTAEYITQNSSLLFESNPPVIHYYPDQSTTVNYSMVVDAGNGGFLGWPEDVNDANNDYPISTSKTINGTKDFVNNRIKELMYFKKGSSNISCELSRNGVVVTSFNLSLVEAAGSPAPSIQQEFTSAGSTTINLSVAQALYHKLDFQIVAGGGGGVDANTSSNHHGPGGGGGGGYQVTNFNFYNYSSAAGSRELTGECSITVGAGGPARPRGTDEISSRGGNSGFSVRRRSRVQDSPGVNARGGYCGGNNLNGSSPDGGWSGTPHPGGNGSVQPFPSSNGSISQPLHSSYDTITGGPTGPGAYSAGDPVGGAGPGGCKLNGNCTRTYDTIRYGCRIVNAFRDEEVSRGGLTGGENTGSLTIGIGGGGAGGNPDGDGQATAGGTGYGYIWIRPA